MSKELKCWSCKAVFTLSEHANCDGCCWKCGVEIDLDEMDIQPADQHPQGTRERFQKWVLSIEHPVKGWLDGHWLRRGDDREGYADEYVQGLWVAFKTFGAQRADQQGEPVMRLEAEKLWGGDGEYSVDFVKPGWLKECREKGGTFLLYARAQPATAKVVLPDRKSPDDYVRLANNAVRAAEWNACLEEVAKLNTPQ